MQSAYRVAVAAIHGARGDLGAWLAQVNEAVAPLMDDGSGSTTYVYDCSQSGEGRIGQSAALSKIGKLDRLAREYTARLAPEAMRELYDHDVSLSSSVPFARDLVVGLDGHLRDVLGGGKPDFLGVNARIRDGFGVHIVAGVNAPFRLSRTTCAALRRVACHVTLAFRRHLGAAPERPDGRGSFYSPNGKCLDGGGVESVPDEVFRRAVRYLDGSTRAHRRMSGDELASVWEPFVEGGLELLETADTDGKRFFVLRPRDAGDASSRMLSANEQRVTIQSMLGQSQKQIAYAMGLSPSRVSQLRSGASRIVARNK